MTVTTSPHALQIGPHTIPNRVVVAPMAGVTDLPLRELTVALGAGMAVGEMLTADLTLKDSRKSHFRRQSSDRAGIRSVQIVGSDPVQLAQAARFNADEGADIIDINMGCPAKKVCKKAAGSALLADEGLVERILNAVVNAVNVPVTLKIRTGVSREERNGVTIARIAEQAGIQMLAVHGRTRADRFKGQAEYDTIAAIANAVSIPVLANGDITCADKAREVMRYTGAAGVMIGRGAQGKPWLPGMIARALTDQPVDHPAPSEQCAIIRHHLSALHEFYGDFLGVRIARKHIGWFVDGLNEDPLINTRLARWPVWTSWKSAFNRLETAQEQVFAFDYLAEQLGDYSAQVITPSTASANLKPRIAA